MRRRFNLFLVCGLISGLFLLFCLTAEKAAASIEGPSVFKGKISDVAGRPVEGARVFVYDSTDVRRTANFISAGSDKDGLFSVVLPPGKYWAIARLKKTEDYGPLMPGDKHSGEPNEVEVVFRGEVAMDFVVADLKEALRARGNARERPVQIAGRIIDGDGTPVRGAYVIAHKSGTVNGIPDYLSAWVDDDGRYTLYLPKGSYYIGTALVFPPGNNYFMQGNITVEGDRTDMDIIRKSPGTK